ncbi:MAG: hypothetical protein LLF75_03510 [Eubacteriales bacterium]|nr:hypothetical protein [Eubacteriales bacterium]
MVRFLRNWLVLILAGILATGIAIAFVPLSRREETRAKSELSLLLEQAFTTVREGKTYADPVVAAEEENLMSKAHAIVRFLEYDDSLLQTDALNAFCSQLSVDRIDVANLQGELIASSDAARVGLSLADDESFGWAMAAADDPAAELLQTDAADRSLLYACAGRTDIDGFVLLTRDDPFVDDALEKSSTNELLSKLPYNGDLVFESTAGGADGAFYDKGCLCIRQTQDGATLIAARTTADVYRMRNAALAAFGVIAVCAVICGIASYLLRLEPVVVLDETGADEAADTEPDIAIPKKDRGRRGDLPESAEEREIETQHERAKKRAPRQIKRTGRKKPPDGGSQGGEESFEQMVE